MNEQIRLNKYISDAGVCSRREADRLIASGCVQVNGIPAQVGMQITKQDVVTCRGTQITPQDELVLVAYYKPVGVVCTSDRREKNHVYRYFSYPGKLKYIGRLDKQSEGLLLFTNQGSLADAVAKAKNGHEKEYEVLVNRPVTDAFLNAMRKGLTIWIDGKAFQTRPAVVKKLGKYRFSIVLTQGFNRQIRRMCEVCGYHVRALKRIRIMNIRLDGLTPGAYRLVEGTEKEMLLSRLQDTATGDRATEQPE